MAIEVAEDEKKPNFVDVKKTLEQRYIALLEKRITDLEQKINTESSIGVVHMIIAQTPRSPIARNEENDRWEDNKMKNGTEIQAGEKTDGATLQLTKKPRVRSVVSKWNENLGSREDREVGIATSSSEPSETRDEDEHAVTLRRVMNTEDPSKLNYTEVNIRSPGLRTFLKEKIASDHPNQSWEGQVINMVAPFAPIVFNWDKLDQETKAREGDDTKLKVTRQDLADLLYHLKRTDELTDYFKTRESNREANLTTYSTMWTIFAPGTEVVVKTFLNNLQVFRVSSWPKPGSGGNRKSVICWGYDWNGKDFVKCFYTFSIGKFEGTKEIDTLDYYPLEFYQDETLDFEDESGAAGHLRTSLIERGQLFHELYKTEKGAKQMFDYNGLVLWSRFGRGAISKGHKDDDEKQSSSYSEDNSNQEKTAVDSTDSKPYEVTGRVIINAAAFRQFGPGNLPLGTNLPFFIADPSDKTEEVFDVLEESHYLLCPPRLLGYAAKEKTWGQFRINAVKYIEGRKETSAFDKDLQLDKTYKNMIKAMVENHSRIGDKGKADIVKGKGSGLVLLLHGPPGVGKTLTAETIAEHTGKPLLVVSVAEIGLTASVSEKNLDRMFALAGAWEAILLVDEADVFLESRSQYGDPNRNALISVLLRVLEYYQGIMVLTTNRINSLDIAVQSRIHLAIRYDDLRQADKANIFNFFLEALPYDSPHEREKLKDWIAETGSDYKLNGRQIRNAVSTAHALACSEGNGRNITREHFKRVTSLTKDFQEQLEKLTMQRRGDNEAPGK